MLQLQRFLDTRAKLLYRKGRALLSTSSQVEYTLIEADLLGCRPTGTYPLSHRVGRLGMSRLIPIPAFPSFRREPSLSSEKASKPYLLLPSIPPLPHRTILNSPGNRKKRRGGIGYGIRMVGRSSRLPEWAPELRHRFIDLPF